MSSPHQGQNNNTLSMSDFMSYYGSYITLTLFVALTAATAVAIWSFLFEQPQYIARVYVSVKDSGPEAITGLDASKMFRGDEVKRNLVDSHTLSLSKEYEKALLFEILNKTELSTKYPAVKGQKLPIQEYIKRTRIKSGRELAKHLRDQLRIDLDYGAGQLIIFTETASPELSQALVNIAAITLVELNHKLHLKQMDYVVDFIQGQTERTRKKLEQLEAELAEIQKTNKIFATETYMDQIDIGYIKSQHDLQKLKMEVSAMDIWIKQIDKAIVDMQYTMAHDGDTHQYLSQLQRRLEILKYQKSIQGEEIDRSIASEEVREVNDAISEARKGLNRAFQKLKENGLTVDPKMLLKQFEQSLIQAKSQQGAANAKLKAFERMLISEESSYESLPDVFRKISELRRSIKLASDLYNRLKQTSQEKEIEKIAKPNFLKIALFAEKPESSASMNLWAKVIFTFVGSTFFIIIILGVKFISIPTVRSDSELGQVGAEVISRIPFFNKKMFQLAGPEDYPLVMRINPDSRAAVRIREAHFMLRQKLKTKDGEVKQRFKVVTVISANKGEGKTFMVANLGYSLSLAQFKVLMLDLNGSNPELHMYYNKEIKKWKKDPVEHSLIRLSDKLDLVSFKARGHSLGNIMETSKFEKFIQSLESQYDLILIDVPAINESVEAFEAVCFSDCALLVVNQQQSARELVFQTVAHVRKFFNGPIYSLLNFSYSSPQNENKRAS